MSVLAMEICTHSLLVNTHGNFKPNVYRVHIKNSSTHPFFNLMCTWIKYQSKYYTKIVWVSWLLHLRMKECCCFRRKSIFYSSKYEQINVWKQIIWLVCSLSTEGDTESMYTFEIPVHTVSQNFDVYSTHSDSCLQGCLWSKDMWCISLSSCGIASSSKQMLHHSGLFHCPI